jgi:hypothetical protein
MFHGLPPDGDKKTQVREWNVAKAVRAMDVTEIDLAGDE